MDTENSSRRKSRPRSHSGSVSENYPSTHAKDTHGKRDNTNNITKNSKQDANAGSDSDSEFAVRVIREPKYTQILHKAEDIEKSTLGFSIHQPDSS